MSSAKDRPSLPERYNAYLNVSSMLQDLNTVVRGLEEAYERGRDEGVFKSLLLIRRMRDRLANDFNTKEELFRAEELRELLDNLGMFPHSVQTWILMYRDDELDYKDESG
jgi:hypothetical protein